MLRLALHWQILITMTVGAVAGVLLNATMGDFTTPEPIPIRDGKIQVLGMAEPAQVKKGSVWIEDSPEQVLIQINELDPKTKRYQTRRILVRSPSDEPVTWPDPPPQVDPDAPITVNKLPTIRLLIKDDPAASGKTDPAAYGLFQLHGRSTARWVGDMADAIGGLFLRLLKMVSVPLIITSLVTGVTGLGHAERLGKMFGRTLSYYLITSLLAIVTGLLMVNMIKPGVQMQAPAAPAAQQAQAESPPAHRQREGKTLSTVLFEQLENMIPANPFEAVASGNFLSIISFSIAFGVFSILVGGEIGAKIAAFAEASFEVMMRMTLAIIKLAPIGVLFLMLSATATQGIGVFGSLGYYMLTVACALAFHAIVTMPLILKFIARRNPPEYAKAMSPALLTAFSSASSNGTLPLTMTCAEENAGVSNRVTSFVLPLGATVNMDGTALYEVVAVLFIAQLSGIDLSLGQQLIVAFTALLASIGAAGIPHAGLVMMVIILQAVNLPTESQGLIIAVDRVLDMARTSVNVWSDSCGCAVISHFETEGGSG